MERKILEKYISRTGKEWALVINEKGNYSIQSGKYIANRCGKNKEKAYKIWSEREWRFS